MSRQRTSAARRDDRASQVPAAASAVLAAVIVLALASPARALVIWCWGDSITDHYSYEVAYVLGNDTVVNYGVGGETTWESLARARETIANATTIPDVVVLELGANDFYRSAVIHVVDETPEEAAANVAAIRQLFFAAGIRHVVTTTTTIAAHAGDRVEWLRKYRAQIRTMRPWLELRVHADELYPDRLHPSPFGDLKLAYRIARAVRSAVRSDR